MPRCYIVKAWKVWPFFCSRLFRNEIVKAVSIFMYHNIDPCLHLIWLFRMHFQAVVQVVLRRQLFLVCFTKKNLATPTSTRTIGPGFCVCHPAED
jgi:hypothetical protein